MSQSTELKPIKVWGKGGPNPPKVAMLLAELGLPHEIIAVDFKDVKNPEYVAINPNGRLPSMHDPNTDITIWESGAILLYLIDKYDQVDHKLSFPAGSPESYAAQQWLFYQVSGQGPYFGQAVWFKWMHPEKIPSAWQRYTKEATRVTAVVEGHLAKQREKFGEDAIAASNGPWLVGNKFSYADLAWVPWQLRLAELVEPEDGFNPAEFPTVKAWLERLMERESIANAMKESK